MGWASRTKHVGPGMHNTRRGGRGARVWSQKDLARSLNQDFRLGQAVPSREKGVLLHRPSGHGKGKWQSIATLRRYKVACKAARIAAAASRAVNRAA